jgi:transposase
MELVSIQSRQELFAYLKDVDNSVLVEKLVDALMEIQRLRLEIEQLKAKPETHSGNSSMPPSTDRPKTKAEQKKARQEARERRKKGEAKPKGGQPGHKGHFRERELEPDRTEQYLPPCCPECSGPVDASCITTAIEPIWHQIYELVLKPVEVIEHRSPGCQCPGCGAVFQMPLPETVTKAAYGPRLAAFGLFLRGVAQSSTRDVVEIFKTILKTPASLGTISNFEARLADVLAIPYEEVLEALQRAKIVNVDETTWYMLSERNVLWVATTEDLVAYRIDTSKGREAFEKLLGVDFEGIVGSDRAKAYDDRDPALRQVCWAHLDRNFQKLYDTGGKGKKLAEAFLHKIDELFVLWHQYQEDALSKEQFSEKIGELKYAFSGLMDEALENTESSVHEICNSLDNIWEALWTFSRVDGVEPTNNSAERAARPAVTLRKTSLGSQSERGNRFVAYTLTAVQTLRKQGRNAYEYLVAAMEAWRQGNQAPSLLPSTPSG